MTREEAAQAIGAQVIHWAGRVKLADKCVPGAAGRFKIEFKDRSFDVLMTVARG